MQASSVMRSDAQNACEMQDLDGVTDGIRTRDLLGHSQAL
jgi:hypothetical protein